jgi:preprotein translocase subunit YajC
MLLVGVLAVVFLMILPERQRRKQQQAMTSSLKIKDRVLTIGGIIGVISNISDKDDEITLRLEEGKLRITKSSIMRVLKSEETAVSSDAVKKG